ncbi:MAG: hypothetical protein KJ709_06930 [Nanoarchaeota archaeon]|nr:hypothetical protein [Nanoarchaeota archaeon]
MPETLQEVRRLSPQERIERLHKLKEEHLKGIEEADSLIEESKGEIERDRLADSIEVPDSPRVDITDLFKGSETTVEEKAEEEPEDNLRYQALQDYEFVKDAVYSSLEDNDMDQLRQIERRLDEMHGLNLSKDISNMLDATRSVLYNIKRYQGL